MSEVLQYFMTVMTSFAANQHILFIYLSHDIPEYNNMTILYIIIVILIHNNKSNYNYNNIVRPF